MPDCPAKELLAELGFSIAFALLVFRFLGLFIRFFGVAGTAFPDSRPSRPDSSAPIVREKIAGIVAKSWGPFRGADVAVAVCVSLFEQLGSPGEFIRADAIVTVGVKGHDQG